MSGSNFSKYCLVLPTLADTEIAKRQVSYLKMQAPLTRLSYNEFFQREIPILIQQSTAVHFGAHPCIAKHFGTCLHLKHLLNRQRLSMCLVGLLNWGLS